MKFLKEFRRATVGLHRARYTLAYTRTCRKERQTGFERSVLELGIVKGKRASLKAVLKPAKITRKVIGCSYRR